jgi:hypothetical protein
MAVRILDVPIKRVWFDRIVKGKKKTEYRDFGPFWRVRLEGKQYDQIRFRNGYAVDAPMVVTEFRGVRKNPTKRRYEIRIGEILRTKNLGPKS